MMQVQKGQVKYKDRNDIICTYGTIDNGTNYCFLDGEKLGEGKVVASTSLVEAIDPLVAASNIGVIDQDGNVIIPFNYKAIKPIFTKYLLAEVAKPVTPSVIQAAASIKDPLAATKLVSNSANLKAKVNQAMGEGGRFLFNDQFSEATVFDLNGNNLLDNKLYSFIGYNNDKLYLVGNTEDSQIIEFSLKEEPIKEEAPVEAPVEKVEPEEVEKPAESKDEIKDFEVSSEDIDKALSGEDKNFHPVVPGVIEKKEEFADMPNGLPVALKKVTLERNDNNKGNILDDTTTIITNLIKQNREQKELIKSLRDSKDKAFRENEALVHDKEALQKRVKELEKEVEELKNSNPGKETSSADKEKLVQLLNDAKGLLED